MTGIPVSLPAQAVSRTRPRHPSSKREPWATGAEGGIKSFGSFLQPPRTLCRPGACRLFLKTVMLLIVGKRVDIHRSRADVIDCRRDEGPQELSLADFVRGPETQSEAPNRSISSSVRRRTLREGCCPGGRTTKIPKTGGGYRPMTATRAPDARCSVISPSGSIAMPCPAIATAAIATALSALTRPCGLIGNVVSPSVNYQGSAP